MVEACCSSPDNTETEQLLLGQRIEHYFYSANINIPPNLLSIHFSFILNRSCAGILGSDQYMVLPGH